MSVVRSLEQRVVILIATGVALTSILLGAIGVVAYRRQQAHLDASHAAIVHSMTAQVDRELTQLLAVLQEVVSQARSAMSGATPIPRDALRRPFIQSRIADAVFIVDRTGRELAHEGSLRTPPAGELAGVLSAAETRGAATSERIDVPRPQVVACIAINDLRGAMLGAACGSIDIRGRRAAEFFALLRQYPNVPAMLVDRSGRDLAGPAGQTPSMARHRESLRNAPWVLVLPEHGTGGSPAALAVGAAATMMALLGLLAWGVGRSVRVPLDALRDHAERLAGGDLSTPVPIAGEDEIGLLGRAFERMRQALDRSIQALADSNSQLEARVADRTAALARANEELEARDRQRARLLRQLITAQEDERRRLARELHDDTCQALAALALRLDMALAATPDDAVNPELFEARNIATRALDDAHRLIHDLRPTALDELGLVAALQRVIDRHLTPAGVAARIETDEWPARLSRTLETTLFRAAQEAIVNVARHGHAEHVLVQCRATGARLVIEVEDDGSGFDVASVGGGNTDDARGLGLMGMRERMASIDGTVTVDSAPGDGTRIVLDAPHLVDKA